LFWHLPSTFVSRLFLSSWGIPFLFRVWSLAVETLLLSKVFHFTIYMSSQEVETNPFCIEQISVSSVPTKLPRLVKTPAQEFSHGSAKTKAATPGAFPLLAFACAWVEVVSYRSWATKLW
jgi:hypothetical protein